MVKKLEKYNKKKNNLIQPKEFKIPENFCTGLQPQRRDGDDIRPLIELYQQTSDNLKEKMSSTQELIDSLNEDVEAWALELASVTKQLSKYHAQIAKK